MDFDHELIREGDPGAECIRGVHYTDEGWCLIPVTIHVHDYAPARPAYRQGHPDNWSPPEPESFAYEAIVWDAFSITLTSAEEQDVREAYLRRAELERDAAFESHYDSMREDY